MQQLLLCVTYTAKPGMREKFMQELLSSGLLDEIRQEEGCLGYAYYFSVQDEDDILLVEQWDTEAHQKRHLEQPHMEKLRSIKNCYVVDTRVEKAFRG